MPCPSAASAHRACWRASAKREPDCAKVEATWSSHVVVSVESVLRPPTFNEQLLFDVLADVYLKYGQWPSWAYIEEMLDRRGVDPPRTLHGLPYELAVRYGYLYPARAGAPNASDRLGLTVAGFSYVDRAKPIVEGFLSFLDRLGQVRAGATLEPFTETRPVVSRAQLLEGRLDFGVHGPLVFPLFSHEPATWHSIFSPLTPEWESVELAPELRRFAGVSSVEDYLDRLSAWIGAPVLVAPRTEHSPFALGAAIDYLDLVWQRRFGSPLVVPPGVERSQRLSMPAGGPEEADSRLSALAELLKGLRVPGVPGLDGHPLQRLQRSLKVSYLPSRTSAFARRSPCSTRRAKSAPLHNTLGHGPPSRTLTRSLVSSTRWSIGLWGGNKFRSSSRTPARRSRTSYARRRTASSPHVRSRAVPTDRIGPWLHATNSELSVGYLVLPLAVRGTAPAIWGHSFARSRCGGAATTAPTLLTRKG